MLTLDQMKQIERETVYGKPLSIEGDEAESLHQDLKRSYAALAVKGIRLDMADGTKG